MSILEFLRGADIKNYKIRISPVLFNELKGRLRLNVLIVGPPLVLTIVLPNAILRVSQNEDCKDSTENDVFFRVPIQIEDIDCLQAASVSSVQLAEIVGLLDAQLGNN